jgi:hypothetical protein
MFAYNDRVCINVLINHEFFNRNRCDNTTRRSAHSGHSNSVSFHVRRLRRAMMASCVILLASGSDSSGSSSSIKSSSSSLASSS